MREKYETLSVSVLKDLAKSRGIKGVSKLKKSEVIDAMLALDEEEKNREENINEANNRAENMGEENNRAENIGAENNLVDNKSAENNRADNKSEDNNLDRNKREDKKYQDKKRNFRKKTEVNNENIKSDNKKSAETKEFDNIKTDESKAETENKVADGILEVLQDGYGFIRCENYMPGANDVYVSPSQIRKFNLKTGDIIHGTTRRNNPTDKFGALIHVESINGYTPDKATKRPNFENLTPVFPNSRIRLERRGGSVATRIVDLISPIGKGQRGMIVSQPKAGKTTLLKEVAKSVIVANPDMHLIILLIDERPEEVTDMMETIKGEKVEVIYSTFDELPEHHKRVSEMVIERAKRLVEHGEDVMILLDSITRLTRAYNLTVTPSGRTLSGGLDPAALHMPKRFFGAARNMREGGSLTILATALVETGSKMDDIVFEEFKGTGNMELVLDRKLSEKRVFPAIDLSRSSTRREDLLLSREEREAVDIIRKGLNGMKKDDAAETILNLFARTKTNQEVCQAIIRKRML